MRKSFAGLSLATVTTTEVVRILDEAQDNDIWGQWLQEQTSLLPAFEFDEI